MSTAYIIFRLRNVFFGQFYLRKNVSRGMKGFVIMDSLKDSQESIVLTFWETKDDMDCFTGRITESLRIFLKVQRPYLKRCQKEMIN
jgi:hypothetical protein